MTSPLGKKVVAPTPQKEPGAAQHVHGHIWRGADGRLENRQPLPCPLHGVKRGGPPCPYCGQ